MILQEFHEIAGWQYSSLGITMGSSVLSFTLSADGRIPVNSFRFEPRGTVSGLSRDSTRGILDL